MQPKQPEIDMELISELHAGRPLPRPWVVHLVNRPLS